MLISNKILTLFGLGYMLSKMLQRQTTQAQKTIKLSKHQTFLYIQINPIETFKIFGVVEATLADLFTILIDSNRLKLRSSK